MGIDLIGRTQGEALYTRVALEREKGPLLAVWPVNHTKEKHSPSAWRMSHAIPSWSWHGCEGKPAMVEVYARAAKVALKINGKTVGEAAPRNDCVVRFSCTYEDGTVEAVSYDAAGNEIGRTALHTANTETRLCLVPEEETVRPGGLAFVQLRYTDENGTEQTIAGDYFLSSMPVKDLIASMQSTPDAVPADIAQIAAGLPYRDFVTVGLLVDKLNLVNGTDIKTLGNITPDCWIYVQDVGVKLGRIQIFNNWSPYMLPDPEHHVWIGLEYFCNEGDDFWNMSDKDCTEFAIMELIKMGVIHSAANVQDSHREKVKKAYPAYFDTYDHMDDLIAYLNRYDNLFCIGRNGQHRYNNMDHSMATAFEAVDNIRKGITDKNNVWNVNTEQEYHEAKQTETSAQ